MVTWWQGAHDIFVAERVTQQKLASAIATARVSLRDGARELFEICAAHAIPVLVFSAGAGDVVRGVLERELGALAPTVHFVANWMRWGDADASGDRLLLGFTEPIIHVFNKCEVHLRSQPEVHAMLARRGNAILVGDSTGDASMGDGLPHDAVLKVGLLNAAAPTAEERAAYTAAFDAVLIGDAPLDAVVAVLKEAVGPTPTPA